MWHLWRPLLFESVACSCRKRLAANKSSAVTFWHLPHCVLSILILFYFYSVLAQPISKNLGHWVLSDVKCKKKILNALCYLWNAFGMAVWCTYTLLDSLCDYHCFSVEQLVNINLQWTVLYEAPFHWTRTAGMTTRAYLLLAQQVCFATWFGLIAMLYCNCIQFMLARL